LKTIQEKLPVLISGLIIILLVIILSFFQIQALKKVEYSLYDFLLAQVEQTEASGLVSIVDIDEQSLAQFGQWPWPRYKIAKLLKKLQQMNVLATGIDFLFAEPDRTSLKQIQDDLQSIYQLPVSLDNVPPQLLDNDQLMENALTSGPFVMAYSFLFNKEEHKITTTANTIESLHPLNLLYLYEPNAVKNNLMWYQADNVVNNISQFSNAVSSSGFVNISPDNDGIIRKVPLIMQYKNNLFPSLSLATLLTAINAKQLLVKVSQTGLDSILIDEQQIPLDKQGNFWIHFRKQNKTVFQTISAADILNDKISMDKLSNHVVLLGTSAKGLYDLRATPYKAVTSGVEIHATIIDNILRGDFISIPTESQLIELLLIILVGLISIVIIIRGTVIISSVANLLLITLLLFSSWWWLQQGVYLSTFYTILTILLNFTILSVFQSRFKEIKLINKTIELNKIQESAITMLKHANIDLEENSIDLEQKIENKSKQLSNAFEALDKSNQEISDSLQYAARIQSSLLPQSDITSIFTESFVIWEPRDKVGGDIYFTSKTKNGYIIAVIDCTGHGIPGALLSMIAISTLKQIVVIEGDESPVVILRKLNQSVKTTLGQEQENAISDDGLEISLCFIAVKEQQLYYAGAGLPLIIIQNNQLKIIKADRQKIGYRQAIKSDINYQFTEHQIVLDQATYCYLFTDGLMDQPGGEKSLPFGKRRLKQFLLELHQLNATQQKNQLMERFLIYQGKQNRRDDITIIGLNFNSSIQ
jgi:CHASE2 domain-containing sensor protein/serine phosphatase RsbU (regulator of sigma subunit)